MSGSVLRAENLHLWRSERHVLKGIGLTVRGGELLQLTGANGAGKTTLLRALCGLNHLEEGRVFWNEQDVREDRSGFHASLVYLGHEPPLTPDLSGVENIRFWIGIRRPIARAAIDDALRSTGAGDQGGVRGACECGKDADGAPTVASRAHQLAKVRNVEMIAIGLAQVVATHAIDGREYYVSR